MSDDKSKTALDSKLLAKHEFGDFITARFHERGLDPSDPELRAAMRARLLAYPDVHGLTHATAKAWIAKGEGPGAVRRLIAFERK
ncbi:MAG: hypothetical protein V4850_16355 [Myxococcota bacterium]